MVDSGERNLRDELGAMPELDEPLDFNALSASDKKGPQKTPEELEKEIFIVALQGLIEEEGDVYFRVPMTSQLQRAAIYKSGLIAKAGIVGYHAIGEIDGNKVHLAQYEFTNDNNAKRWLEVASKYRS